MYLLIIIGVIPIVTPQMFIFEQVLMECGNRSEVTDVTEPHTCDYQLVFHTPLVCHPHALLVYPSLNNSLQEEWDLIEGRLLNDELTKQVSNGRVDTNISSNQ